MDWRDNLRRDPHPRGAEGRMRADLYFQRQTFSRPRSRRFSRSYQRALTKGRKSDNLPAPLPGAPLDAPATAKKPLVLIRGKAASAKTNPSQLAGAYALR